MREEVAFFTIVQDFGADIGHLKLKPLSSKMLEQLVLLSPQPYLKAKFLKAWGLIDWNARYSHHEEIKFLDKLATSCYEEEWFSFEATMNQEYRKAMDQVLNMADVLGVIIIKLFDFV